MRRIFTSESVTEGHPDKICDQISDAVLDEILKNDPSARVACETATTTGLVLLMGEISTDCYVDIPRVVRRTIDEIGYNNPVFGFDCNTCAVITSIDEQSADISRGVNKSLEVRGENEEALEESEDLGAGDQGMVFGFACDETEEYMPMPISLAQKLAIELAKLRKTGVLDYLRPDGKTQVSVEYEGNKPIRVEAVVVSTQHSPEVSVKKIRQDLIKLLIEEHIPKDLIDKNTKIYVNPTGRFVIGGPQGDSGLTGRKIIVDTYGGYASHGGGAFSGKDPTKVDRSAAYAARHIAKNLVAAGAASQCEIEIAYAIGVAQPVSITVDTRGTGLVSNQDLVAIIRDLFDLRPGAIIKNLQLRRPIYRQIAAYGHFGRNDLDLPWEKLDKVDMIKEKLKEYTK